MHGQQNVKFHYIIFGIMIGIIVGVFIFISLLIYQVHFGWPAVNVWHDSPLICDACYYGFLVY
jgi:hypothetical protein